MQNNLTTKECRELQLKFKNPSLSLASPIYFSSYISATWGVCTFCAVKVIYWIWGHAVAGSKKEITIPQLAASLAIIYFSISEMWKLKVLNFLYKLNIELFREYILMTVVCEAQYFETNKYTHLDRRYCVMLLKTIFLSTL